MDDRLWLFRVARTSLACTNKLFMPIKVDGLRGVLEMEAWLFVCQKWVLFFFSLRFVEMLGLFKINVFLPCGLHQFIIIYTN